MLIMLFLLGQCLGDRCYPCQSRLTVYEADFTKGAPISWFNGTDPKWILSGVGSTGLSSEGLEFSAMPYLNWTSDPSPFYLDHEKAKLELTDQPFTDQHLYVEVELCGRTFGTENNPFPDDMVQENDLRLANCGIAFTKYFENVGAFSLMVLLTNDRIYLVWEARNTVETLPFGGVIAAPIARRCPDQCHKLQIEIIPGLLFFESKVWVDGKAKGSLIDQFQIQNLSSVPLIIYNLFFVPLNGDNPIFISFVHNTFLDAYCPCKDTGPVGCGGDVNPCALTNVTYGLVDTGVAIQQFNPYDFPAAIQAAEFWDPVGTNVSNHIWGQGSDLLVKRILVRSVTSGCQS